MQTNDQLLAIFENYLAQLSLPQEPELLYNPIEYSLAGGGKRLRPLLLLLSCEAFSGSHKAALDAAAAVEVFHNFTLLHDDIMDHSPMRRGKPSVAARWGENVAILSGDAMLITAYRLLCGTPAPMLGRVMKVFNTMAVGVCEGQQ
jgi:geranylgeranyl diphosphate synthase type II